MTNFDKSELEALREKVWDFRLLGATEQADLIDYALKLHDLLLRARDAIVGQDGTSVENEKLIDDYLAIFGD